MALPRHVHDLIGGFAAFGEVLAEDQAIGLAVREAGFRVVLSPVVVSNVIERRTLARALDRQVRWGKIRYAFSKFLFAGELLMNPFPVALLAALLAVPGGSPWAGPLSSLAARLASSSAFSRRASWGGSAACPSAPSISLRCR